MENYGGLFVLCCFGRFIKVAPKPFRRFLLQTVHHQSLGETISQQHGSPSRCRNSVWLSSVVHSAGGARFVRSATLSTSASQSVGVGKWTRDFKRFSAAGAAGNGTSRQSLWRLAQVANIQLYISCETWRCAWKRTKGQEWSHGSHFHRIFVF